MEAENYITKEALHMIVRFSAKDAALPENILYTMEKKLHQRLDGYYRGEAADATTIFVKASEKKRIFKVEINMPYDGQLLRSEHEERDNIMPALDKGIDVLERQIKKHKTRMTRHLRDSIKPGDKVLDAPEAAEIEENEGDQEFRVVREKRYESKPMTTQDALLQMDLLGHNFYMFHNTDTGSVCTVYRRNDGDYGLIQLV
jgi:putative sigma-54 modulation protein